MFTLLISPSGTGGILRCHKKPSWEFPMSFGTAHRTARLSQTFHILSLVMISRNLPQYLKCWTSRMQSQHCFSTPVMISLAPVSFTCWLQAYKCVTLVPLSNDRMLEMCHLCQVPADWAAKYCTQLPFYCR